MEIKIIGEGERLLECAALLKACGAGGQYRSVIILPIPTTRDKKYITGTEITLSSFSESLKEGELAVGYAIPKETCSEARQRGADIYDLSLDEGFLKENAYLTAKGALGVILTDFPREPADMKIGIIGYGRIGSALLSLLLFIGASPKVYTTRESVCLALCESGVDAELVFSGTDFSALDLIVNTAPAKIISDGSQLSLPDELKILDLASGKIFNGSPRVKKLASIPETMYPKTGGKIMAKYIKGKLYPVSGEVLL